MNIICSFPFQSGQFCTKKDSCHWNRSIDKRLKISTITVFSFIPKHLFFLTGKDKDRDSGIVITQEIKNLMDSYKDDTEGGVEIDIVDNYNFTNVVENLSAGITGPDDVKKYKKLCVNLVRQLKELGNR